MAASHPGSAAGDNADSHRRLRIDGAERGERATAIDRVAAGCRAGGGSRHGDTQPGRRDGKAR